MMKIFRAILKTIGILTVVNFLLNIVKKASNFILEEIIFIFTPFSRIRDLKNELLIVSNSVNADYKQFPDEVLKGNYPFGLPQKSRLKILPEPIILLAISNGLLLLSLLSLLLKGKSTSTIGVFVSKIGNYDWITIFCAFTFISWFFYQHEKKVNSLNTQLRKQNFENIKKVIVGSVSFDLKHKTNPYYKISEFNLNSNNFEFLRTPKFDSFLLQKCKESLFPILKEINSANFQNIDLFGYPGDFDAILRFAYMEIDVNYFKELHKKTFEIQTQN